MNDFSCNGSWRMCSDFMVLYCGFTFGPWFFSWLVSIPVQGIGHLGSWFYFRGWLSNSWNMLKPPLSNAHWLRSNNIPFLHGWLHLADSENWQVLVREPRSRAPWFAVSKATEWICPSMLGKNNVIQRFKTQDIILALSSRSLTSDTWVPWGVPLPQKVLLESLQETTLLASFYNKA